MTSEEAKSILLLYRPGRGDARDPEMAAALEQARHDPELQRWFDQHRQFQESLQQKFSELPVPQDLSEAILAGRRIVRPALWWQPAWLAAAAAIVILVAVGAFWLRPDPADTFSLYRARMVRMALHEYHMDVVTNDLQYVRRYLGSRGGPAHFALPKPLQPLAVTGGGHIRWGKEPASMVCFDRGDRQMLFLFVVTSGSLRGEPKRPEAAKIGSLQTVSWSQGESTFVLAGPDDPEFAQKYGPAAISSK